MDTQTATNELTASLPPVAPSRPSKRTVHGVTLADDYAWLKDANWQEVLRNPALLDPDIRAHLESENRYTEAFLEPTRVLQKTLVAEMRGRIKEDDASVPQPDGPFAYLWKFREGGQHESIGRMPRDGGELQVLLDGDAIAKGLPYFDFGGTRHSPDHRLEAWSADVRGSEFFTIRVRDWQTGADRPAAASCGASIRPSSITSGSTTTTGPCTSIVIGWAHRKATTSWSTRRRTKAGSRASRKAPRAASASSPPATRRHPSAG